MGSGRNRRFGGARKLPPSRGVVLGSSKGLAAALPALQGTTSLMGGVHPRCLPSWPGRASRPRWVLALTGALLLLLPLAAWASDPQIASLVDSPDPVAAGGLFTYTLGIDNNAADAATNTRVSFSVPSGAVFVSAAPASQNCALLSGSSTTVQCNLGSLGPLGSDVRNIVLTWRATVAGPAVINATATLTADNDANPANNTQTATTTVVQGANLALSKTATPDPVTGGANITYTLTASNAGPNAGGAMVITDNLPPSVSFVSAVGAGWACSHASGVVTCNRSGVHAVGAAIPPVTLVGTVNAAGGTVTNSATVAPAAGGVADPVSVDNTATVNTSVVPGADVRIAQKTVTSVQPATAGQNVSFQIQPRNGGPATAVNVVVTDVLPAGWTYVSASGPNWACSNAGQTVSCSRASFPAGALDDISVVARSPDSSVVAPAGSSYTNTASIGSDTPDPNNSNNAGSATVLVRPDGADLRLAKTKTPNPVALGSTMVSSITVSNGGPRSATGPLRVVESLSGEVFVSASGTGWTCVASGSVVVCDHPNAAGLAVNAALPVLSLTTRATVAGSASNQACTGSSLPASPGSASALPPLQGDPNASNDCVTATALATTVQPDLQISKATSTPTGGDKVLSVTEAAVTYNLVVSNVSLGTDGATGVRFSDAVPGFIVGRSSFGAFNPVVSAGTAVFSCSATAAGIVTCNQTGGVLAQGESVSLALTVNRPLQDGSFTNTASVTNTREGDPFSANNVASDTVVIEPIADVQMTGKSITPGSVRAGENASYVLSFRNNGPSTALGVAVADAFAFGAGDTGLTVVSVVSSKAGSSCDIAAGAQITLAAPSFNCNIGSLANGETQSITVVARPNFMAGNPARSVSNTASISTTSIENPAGGDNGNNSLAATLAITPASLNLLINKTDVVDPVAFFAGGTFLDYRLAVSNAGPSFGTGVKVTETMTPPAGKRVRFVCDTVAAGSAVCNPTPLCSTANIISAPGVALTSFTCDVAPGNSSTGLNRGELASGQSKSIFVRFEALDSPAPTGDVFSNVAVTSANEPDTDLANNTENEPTTTRQRIDLRVSKTSSAPAVALNEPFTWTVTVVNNGPGSSLRTDLVDTLPAGAQLTGPVSFSRTLPALPGGGSCTAAGSVVTCLLGQLDATGVATISVPARFTGFPAGGSGTNSATVDTDPNKTGGIDTPGGNNTGTSGVTVNRASLAGTVFQDRDRSGANAGTPQSAGAEPRLAGVAIRLTGTDAFGNAVDLSTTTDANGNYSFASLPPSSAAGYLVTETQPAGFVNGPAAPPTSGAGAPSAGGSYAAGGAAGNSSYGAVVLAAGTVAGNYNFPELRRVSLSGFVYLDSNGSGLREPGVDAAIAGASVRLLDASTGALLATTTSDASGAYAFANLDPLLSYTLEEPLPASPANLANGPVNPGQINGLACPSGCSPQPDNPAPGTDRIAGIDLSAGVDGTAFNFGERQLTAVNGLVYLDANRNNALDAGEAGRIAGVTLRLVQGADCASGSTLQTTTSAADGSYRFDNVLALQNYLVCQTQPPGYGNGNANGTPGSNVISLTALPAGGSSNNNFGETLASLSGSVYQDNGTGIAAQADNGVKDAGEVGIANVPVTLTGTDLLGNPVTLSTTTDASGNWRFDLLLPANAAGYTVTEGAIPAASGRFIDGRETLGNAGGSSTVNDQFSGITLAAGAQASGYLFGELGLAPISGTVYIDLNRNGQLDPTPVDGRIPGVSLSLVQGLTCSGPVLASTVTDGAGNYSFSGAAAGLTYTVCETQPAGYLNGSENPGTNGSSNAANAITLINLPAGGSTGNHFGEIASNSVISGRVWLDVNNNGVIDPAESGIAGVRVDLVGTDIAGNAVSRSTVTDASGNYQFDALAPGSYSVREPLQPAGTLGGRTLAGPLGGSATAVGTATSAINGIVLGLSQTATANNFGEIPPALVAGRVWADNNNNGLIEPAESGLAGVAVTLAGTDDTGAAVSLSTTTAADGSYSFAALRPGNYSLTEPLQPAGTVNGITRAGTLGGTATPPSVAPSAISSIDLPVGGQALANNFGEIGNSPDLRVAKSHAPASFTVNNAAGYTLTVRNAGELASSGSYTVSDRLPPGLSLAAVPSGSGWTCNGVAGDNVFSCSSSAVIAAGATSAATIQVSVMVGSAVLAAGAVSGSVNNVVLVDGGGEIDARRPSDAERNLFNTNPAGLPVCDPAVLHNACRDPAPVQLGAAVSGIVWSDIGSTPRLLDGADKRLVGWTVELLNPATGAVLRSTTTGADGSYRVTDLVPGVALAIRFRDPASGVVFGYPVNGHTAPGASGAACNPGAAAAGTASSCVGSGADPALTVVLVPGQELTQQSLPVDPSGVVYDSGLRQPVAGAIVTLSPVGACVGWDPAKQLVGGSMGGYAISGGNVAMTVGVDGFYQFLFAPSAPASCNFAITVTPPGGYTAPSALIPAQPGTLSPPGGASAVYPVQPQAGAPTAAVGGGTTYFLLLTAGSGVANIVHNHLPLDPALPGGINLSKTGDKAVAELGDTVRYSITVQLTAGARPRQTTVVDRLPAGFVYIKGTAMVDGSTIADPVGAPGPVLAFNLGPMPAANRQVLQYRVRVAVGSQQGDGINRARAYACGVPAGCVAPGGGGASGFAPLPGSVATNEGQYRVRVSGGVFATEACVLGKIFVDCNGNHVQDDEELGIPGVRLVLSDGTTLISDVEGKYSVCGLPPRSHVLRADPHTLPRGSRLTTSSNRNLGDAGSLWLDLKNGELHRADFVEGSCSNTVLDQVKARRAQGEVRAPETERAGRPALRFDSKSQGRDAFSSPTQGTDGANQQAPKARATEGPAPDRPPQGPADPAEQPLPTPALPMNRPPPSGRETGTAPNVPSAGGSDATR